MIDFGCVSSRIIWIKFKFSRGKVHVLVGMSLEKNEVWRLTRKKTKGQLGYVLLRCVGEEV